MKMKSVIAGEYTAPPAHGPMMTLICGTTPEAMTLRWKHLGITRQRSDAFLNPRAARIVDPDHRRAILHAMSMILQIFWAWVSDSEPPKTVKSWLNT